MGTPGAEGEGRSGLRKGRVFPLSFPLSFLYCLFGALHIFLGYAWVEGKGELATSS